MKNVFCGFNAKLALALLAVGALSSCYEKEELDKTPQKDPDPAKYFIQGNVTNAEDGTPLPSAKVTVGSDAQTLNADGYFITADLKNPGEYKVTSKLATFKPEVKAKVNGVEDNSVIANDKEIFLSAAKKSQKNHKIGLQNPKIGL